MGMKRRLGGGGVRGKCEPMLVFGVRETCEQFLHGARTDPRAHQAPLSSPHTLENLQFQIFRG